MAELRALKSPLTRSEKEMVYRTSLYLRKHRDELQSQRGVPLSQMVAEALGIGSATVNRVLAEVRAHGVDGLREPVKPRGRIRHADEALKLAVRRLVHAKLDALEPYSTSKLHEDLLEEGFDVPARSLHRLLARMNIRYGAGRMRDHLHESAGIVQRRADYVTEKVGWRRPGSARPSLPEIYLDESYCNLHHTAARTWVDLDDGGIRPARSGAGRRFCMVAAGCVWWDGKTMRAETVPDSVVVWDSGKKPPKRKRGAEATPTSLGGVETDTSRDYHGNFDSQKFELWFERMCITAARRWGSCRIIMDGASYHTRTEGDPPRQAAPKSVHVAWLQSQGVPCDLSEPLTSLVRKRAERKKVLRMVTAGIAERHGHRILFTPPYHPELQPIERVWAIVKNPIARQPARTMAELGSRLRANLAAVDRGTWLSAYRKAQAEEDAYLQAQDEQLERALAAEEAESDTET